MVTKYTTQRQQNIPKGFKIDQIAFKINQMAKN
jgi:hypothetical protein